MLNPLPVLAMLALLALLAKTGGYPDFRPLEDVRPGTRIPGLNRFQVSKDSLRPVGREGCVGGHKGVHGE